MVTAACAFGMMAVARTGSLDFKECNAAAVELASELPLGISEEITHLNDRRFLSPQQIADWMEKKGL